MFKSKFCYAGKICKIKNIFWCQLDIPPNDILGTVINLFSVGIHTISLCYFDLRLIFDIAYFSEQRFIKPSLWYIGVCFIKDLGDHNGVYFIKNLGDHNRVGLCPVYSKL